MAAQTHIPAQYLPVRPPDRPQIMFGALLFSAVVHILAIALIDFAPPSSEPRYTPPVINVDMALLEIVDEAAFDPWIETGEATVQLGGAEDYTAPNTRPSQGTGSLDGNRRGADRWLDGPVQSPGEQGGRRQAKRVASPGQHARRIRRLQANSDLKTPETLYLNRWQRKVESVATLYFGQELLGRSGRITVMVVLEPSGRVEGIKILEPSQDKALNEAVINILRASSPFPPFPDEIAAEVDLIEVIRIWAFGSEVGAPALLPRDPAGEAEQP